jgi:hypothetical protein
MSLQSSWTGPAFAEDAGALELPAALPASVEASAPASPEGAEADDELAAEGEGRGELAD